MSSRPPASHALISRFSDFWLLGGASILLWVVMMTGQAFRSHSEAIESHFLQMTAVFSIFSIFCNYPHFMISYRFGYGRGMRFIFQHWLPLLVVPLALIFLYAVAYFKFSTEIADLAWVHAANHIFEMVGLSFRLGTMVNLGTEILSLSVLAMNLTVGWHYSKQVFGCMMVYAKYDGSEIDRQQRFWIKGSLFSVAFLNFFYYAIYAPEYNVNAVTQSYFFNIPLIQLGLPKFLIPLTAVLLVLFSLGTLVQVIYKNRKRDGKWPSFNFLVPWVAFHFWWVPFYHQSEYYMWAIPFFHSLQYLPFAYRMEMPGIQKAKWPEVMGSLKLALLIFIGFCAFELFPSLLDRKLETPVILNTWFFMIAFAVFINVHHFFIDSAVWRFKQPEMKDGIFT